jgi:hypothetical protein
MRPLFENEEQFDGHSLYTLYQQCQSNNESNYQLLNSQLSQYSNQHLPYLTYIHFLSELRKQTNPIDIKYLFHYLLWIIWNKIISKLFV